jgi:hypothetical protein
MWVWKKKHWETSEYFSFPLSASFHHSFILGVFANLRKTTISFVMFVRPTAWSN